MDILALIVACVAVGISPWLFKIFHKKSLLKPTLGIFLLVLLGYFCAHAAFIAEWGQFWRFLSENPGMIIMLVCLLAMVLPLYVAACKFCLEAFQQQYRSKQ